MHNNGVVDNIAVQRDPPDTTMNGVGGKNGHLASLLRECATYVERNEFHPVLYQALGALHAYAGDRAATTPTSSSVGVAISSSGSVTSEPPSVVSAPAAPPAPASSTTRPDPQTRAASEGLRYRSGSVDPASRDISSAFKDVPDLFDAKASADFDRHASPTSGISPTSGEHGVGEAATQHHYSSSFKDQHDKSVLHGFTKGLEKGFKKFGLVGGSHSAHHEDAAAESAHNAQRARADIEEQELEREQYATKRRQQAQSAGYGHESDWCDEHFVMGCACKVRKNLQHEQSVDAAAAAAATATATATAAPQAPTSGGSATATVPPPSPARGVSPQNYPKQSETPSTASTTTTNTATTATTPTTPSRAQSPRMNKPSFQRPINPQSNLLATGWIEQQRRSKMRVVWKDILASLVEGRKPGEETTLWIQRQTTNSQGKAQLEALHQIPMKWLEEVSYLDFYGDHRFALKIFNVSDEFQFRCADKESAVNWVVTLRSARDASLGRLNRSVSGGGPTAKDMGLNNLDDWDATASTSQSSRDREDQRSVSSSDGNVAQARQRLTIKELRAIAHGAGINTRGMERGDLEKIAAKFAPNAAAAPAPATPDPRGTSQSRSSPQIEQNKTAPSAYPKPEVTREEVIRPGHEGHHRQESAPTSAYPKPQVTHEEVGRVAEEKRRHEAALAAAVEQKRQQEELLRRRQQEMAERQAAAEQRRRMEEEQKRQQEEQRRRQEEEIKRQQEIAEQRRRHEEEQRRQQEELRRRQQELAEKQAAEQRRRQAEEEQRRRQAEEEQRRRQAAEEEQRRRQAAAAAEEQRRRQVEEEQRRRQAAAAAEEQRRRQAEEEQRRRQAAAAAAAEEQRRRQAAAAAAAEEQRRRQAEEEQRRRQQQQWQQQQWQQQQWQANQQRQGFYGQQGHQPQQQHFFNGTPPPPPPPPPPRQPENQQRPGAGSTAPGGSPIAAKYAKAMNEKSEEAEQAAITHIKRNILINWALLPPSLQMLRPIDQLVTTIHNAFPPAYGVASHPYFSKWKPISRNDLAYSNVMGNTPDEDKLKKAVRKIRFFLHPDKLPRDLNAEQEFMCRMLWDVTSDAWEEFCTRSEELDWIRG